MGLSSLTYDFHTPSGSSSRTSISGELYRKSSKETIQSHQGSISNSSDHTSASSKATIPKDSVSEQDPFTFDHKSVHSLVKQSCGFRNQSLSAVCTIREPDSNSSFTASSTPMQTFRSLSVSSLEDEFESSQPSIPRSSHATTLILNPSPSPGPGPSPIHAFPIPPSDSFTPSYSAGFIPADEGPFSRLVHRSIHMSTHSRAGTVTAKGKKGILGFMTDILNSNKRFGPEISTPYDPVQLMHVGFNSSNGEFTGLPKKWQQLLQDSGIPKSGQEKNPLAVMEIIKFHQGCGDVWDKMGHYPVPGSFQPPPIPGTSQASFSGPSKPVDDGFIPARPVLSTMKKARSSGGPQVVSTSYPRGSYHCAPTPRQPAQPKPLPSDTLVHANTTKDQRSLGLPASVKASAQESPNSSALDFAIKSQATVGVNSPVTERQAPQPPTVPQQQSAAVASLAKTADATPRRRRNKKIK